MPPSLTSMALATATAAVAGYCAYNLLKGFFSKKTSPYVKGMDGYSDHKKYIPYNGEIPSDVKEQFEEATEIVKNGAISLDVEEQLALYGYYKAATAGHCVAARPSSLNFEAAAKWDAWNECRGLEKEEAMIAYVELLRSLLTPQRYEELLQALRNGGTDEDSLFLTEEEYQEQRKRIKARQGGMQPLSVSTMAPSDAQATTFTDAEETSSLSVLDETLPLSKRLHFVLQNDNVEDFKHLLQLVAGDDLNAQKNYIDQTLIERDTIFFLAIDTGAITIVKYIIDTYKPNLNILSRDGMTALHMALYISNPELVKLLLASGADPTIPDDSNETSIDVLKDLSPDEKASFQSFFDEWIKTNETLE